MYILGLEVAELIVTPVGLELSNEKSNVWLQYALHVRKNVFPSNSLVGLLEKLISNPWVVEGFPFLSIIEISSLSIL